ncbi:hypothetical protein [Tsuneonella sp. HG222]
MHKLFIPTLLAGSLALSACATSPYGMGGGDPLGGLLGGILGSQSPQNNQTQFQQQAANACAQEASRYGRVAISDVRQTERDIVLVYGRVQTQSGAQRDFNCAYRSDNRIVDFQMN